MFYRIYKSTDTNSYFRNNVKWWATHIPLQLLIQEHGGILKLAMVKVMSTMEISMCCNSRLFLQQAGESCWTTTQISTNKLWHGSTRPRLRSASVILASFLTVLSHIILISKMKYWKHCKTSIFKINPT